MRFIPLLHKVSLLTLCPIKGCAGASPVCTSLQHRIQFEISVGCDACEKSLNTYLPIDTKVLSHYSFKNPALDTLLNCIWGIQQDMY